MKFDYIKGWCGRQKFESCTGSGEGGGGGVPNKV